MADFLDEVLEYQKQEFITKFLHKYSKLIIAVAVFIVLCSAIFVYFQHREQTHQEEYSIEYIESFDSNDISKVKQVANKDAKGFSDLAKINYAFLLESKNNQPEAAEIYLNLYKQSKYDEIANFALYRYGMIAVAAQDKNKINNFLETAKNIKSKAFADLISVNMLMSYKINKDNGKYKDLYKHLRKDKNLNAELLTIIDAINTQ